MVNESHEPLFDFIALKIEEFLCNNPEMDISHDDDTDNETLPASFRKLGFTFSFTYDSHSARSGTMLQWDKGWDIPDAIGRDPCTMLQDAIDRRKLRVQVTALTNDSVGTLMAKAYTSSESTLPLIGAIFGTGTNAAYVENLSKIEKLSQLDEPLKTKDTIMAINTEWGAWFDTCPTALPRCAYDKFLDQASLSSGEQLFEKQTSALYLGELARLAISDLVANKQLDMTTKSDSPLEKPYELSSVFLSTLASGTEDPKSTDWEALRKMVTETLHARDVSINDTKILSRLGSAIVSRAAQLAGVAIAAVIIHTGKLPAELAHPKLSRTSGWPERCNWRGIATSLFRFWNKRTDDEDDATFDSDGTLVTSDDCIDIGIDGSLFEYYPGFEEGIRKALRMVPRIGREGEARVKIGLAKDGSSLGAALIAQSMP